MPSDSGGDAQGGIHIGSNTTADGLIAVGGYYANAGTLTPRATSGTSIQFSSDIIRFRSNTGLTVGTDYTPSNRFEINSAETVVNQISADHDFRVESSGNTHALFVEGDGTGIGINTSDPQEALHVTGSIRLDGNNNGTTVGAAVNQLIFKDTDTTTGGGQPFGEIDFVTADSSAPGISARIAGVADSAATAQGRLTLYTGAAGTLRNNITMAVGSVVVNEGSADMCKCYWFSILRKLKRS